MARYNCELYGVVRYSLGLSYHELHAVEEALLTGVQSLLESFSAQHIDFWGYGDMLQFQCSLPEYDVEALHELCDGVKELLSEDIACKMVVLDKTLKNFSVYNIDPANWQEDRIDISDEHFVH